MRSSTSTSPFRRSNPQLLFWVRRYNRLLLDWTRFRQEYPKLFRTEEISGGGQRLELAEIGEFLQDISSSQPTFICIDTLDGWQVRHRVKLLNSLNEILQNSPGARIFLTGRPDLRNAVDNYLDGRAAAGSITPTKNGIVIFPRAKPNGDTIPDAIYKSLEEDIIKNIPETVSEMYKTLDNSHNTLSRGPANTQV